MRENMPNAINEIQWRKELKVEKNKTTFEIIIKENGKVVYHNKAYAGVVNFVQSVDEFNVEEMSMSGDTQVFGFGHPCVQVFALDQLRQKLRPVVEQSISIFYKIMGNPWKSQNLLKLKTFMESVGRNFSIKKGGEKK